MTASNELICFPVWSLPETVMGLAARGAGRDLNNEGFLGDLPNYIWGGRRDVVWTPTTLESTPLEPTGNLS